MRKERRRNKGRGVEEEMEKDLKRIIKKERSDIMQLNGIIIL